MRIGAQREQLTEQPGELEAAERVLARYSKGAKTRRTATAEPNCCKPNRPPRRDWASRTTTARVDCLPLAAHRRGRIVMLPTGTKAPSRSRRQVQLYSGV
jgi:hypothetical protein